MKVLVVRIGGWVSGAEIYNLTLLKALKRYKDIEIVSLTNLQELSDRISKLGHKSVCLKVPIKEIGTKKDFLKALFFSPQYLLKYLKTIKDLEKNGKFEIIVLQSMTEKIFLTPILRFLSYKIIWIEYGPLFVTQRALIIKKLYMLISNVTDKIIAVSKDTERDLRKGGVSKNKIVSIYIGVDPEYFSPLPLQAKKPSIIGFVASVCKEKGIKEFLEVACEVIKKKDDTHFLVIGDGPLLDWAKNEVEKQGIACKFHFTGFVEDIRQSLGIIDILFFPTRHYEGLSMAILDAMAMGIVVVATDIGGNRELVKNGITGFLYDPLRFNKEELKNLLVKILKNKKLKEKVGSNAREYIREEFNIGKNISNFYQLFKDI